MNNLPTINRPTGNRIGERPGRFAATFTTWYAAHTLADHWVQTHRQSIVKAKPGRDGARACAAHVAALTATQTAALALTAATTGLRVNPRRALAALTFNAATHYILDRRRPLHRLAGLFGKTDFATLGDPLVAPTGTGAYALDQSAHITILWLAALIATGGTR